MGQNNNHKSNFHFLILGCKSFAVNYSLKSGTHRHHQTLGFIPGDALPGLYCNCLQFLLVLGAFSLQFCLQQVKCMLNRIQVRCLTWPLHNSPLLSLQKLFGCFCSMLWVIVHLHCEAPSNEFWSICWIWADNIARNTSEFILLLLSAVTSSINTREPVPLAAIHAHATTTMLHWWGGMLRIMSSSLPSQFWNNVLWTDETKINLYQSDGKRRVWRRKGTAHDPKHTISSVKHGGGSVGM